MRISLGLRQSPLAVGLNPTGLASTAIKRLWESIKDVAIVEHQIQSLSCEVAKPQHVGTSTRLF
jgi:hypothetical protein